MNSEVTEDTIVAALEEFCKNDTKSLHMAEDYLLNVMKNPDNLIIFFSIIEKSYPDSVWVFVVSSSIGSPIEWTIM